MVRPQINETQLEELEKIFQTIQASGKPILVEGPNDKRALESWGISPDNIHTVNERNYTQLEVVEKLAHTEEVILLMDFDKKGRELTRRFKRLLQDQKMRPNIRFWNDIQKILLGRCSDIEGLSRD